MTFVFATTAAKLFWSMCRLWTPVLPLMRVYSVLHPIRAQDSVLMLQLLPLPFQNQAPFCLQGEGALSLVSEKKTSQKQSNYVPYWVIYCSWLELFKLYFENCNIVDSWISRAMFKSLFKIMLSPKAVQIWHTNSGSHYLT